MYATTCPHCRASLRNDLVEQTGQPICPFCGRAVPFGDDADVSPRTPELSPPRLAPDLIDAWARSGEPVAQSAIDLPPPPANNTVEVIESTEKRLVLFIPGGGTQTRSMGAFALFWNLFMVVVTPAMTAGLFFGGPVMTPWLVLGLLAFLGLFWAIGLGFLYYWLKLKYERTLILAERERLAVQRILFGKKRIVTTALGPDSRAGLVEAYSDNDRPVYRVEVSGLNGKAKFGTALSNAEKDWLVDCLHQFLHTAPPGASPTTAADWINRPHDEPPTSSVFSSSHLEPANLPPGCLICVDDATAERLRLHIDFLRTGWQKHAALLIAGGLAIGAAYVDAPFLAAARQGIVAPRGLIFLIPAALGVLSSGVALGVGLILARGRSTIELTPENLVCRWHVGRIGFTRRFNTSEIQAVRVEPIGQVDRPRHASPNGQSLTACVVRDGTQAIWLAFDLSSADATKPAPEGRVARQMADLLCTRLRQLRAARAPIQTNGA